MDPFLGLVGLGLGSGRGARRTAGKNKAGEREKAESKISSSHNVIDSCSPKSPAGWPKQQLHVRGEVKGHVRRGDRIRFLCT